MQLNSETLLPIVDWFRRLAIVGTNGPTPEFTSHLIHTDRTFRTRLIEFLRQADIPFADIRVQEEELDFEDMARHVPPAFLDRFKDKDKPRILVEEFGLPQEGFDGLCYLNLDEQSDGTQRVYSFAGPWLDVVDIGRVVVVDELDRSLHPHLVRFLIEFINRQGGETGQNAQLIATVHETMLLQDALDRNQIWFSEKDADQAATLTPASSYSPRKGESLIRGYLGGRYGAIPNVVSPATCKRCETADTIHSSLSKSRSLEKSTS